MLLITIFLVGDGTLVYFSWVPFKYYFELWSFEIVSSDIGDG
jgi:hypothetical protein